MPFFTVSLPGPRTSADDESTIEADFTWTIGDQTRSITLPVDGCPAILSGDVPDYRQPTAPGEHVWGMPINCYPHDYAHVAGIGCWNCGEHYFFGKSFCPDED